MRARAGRDERFAPRAQGCAGEVWFERPSTNMPGPCATAFITPRTGFYDLMRSPVAAPGAGVKIRNLYPTRSWRTSRTNMCRQAGHDSSTVDPRCAMGRELRASGELKRSNRDEQDGWRKPDMSAVLTRSPRSGCAIPVRPVRAAVTQRILSAPQNISAWPECRRHRARHGRSRAGITSRDCTTPTARIALLMCAGKLVGATALQWWHRSRSGLRDPGGGISRL